MNLSKVHPELRNRILYIQAIAKSYGIHSTITSGFRTYEEQKRLYLHPEGFPVSPPGCTTHELGLAIDLVASGDRTTSTWLNQQRYLQALGSWIGLYSNESDPIHFVLFSPSQIEQIKAQFCR